MPKEPKETFSVPGPPFGPLPIVLWDDPILSTPCPPVYPEEFGEGLNLLGLRMLGTIENKGLGLAAPQVGLSKRLMVMILKDGRKVVAANPVLEVPEGDNVFHDEACLSMPGIYAPVGRRGRCRLTYQEPLLGKGGSLDLEDYDAFCAQHEVDHLDGIMFFQRMANHYKKKVLKLWNKTRRKPGSGS